MNRLVTRLSALAIAALCATSAAARTVSVASVGESAAALAFGDADGKTYRLAVCYGDEDGGATTAGWDACDVLGSVGAAETSRTVALPAGWGSAATHLRFFLLTPEIPEDATRVEYLQSNGNQFINTGVRGRVGVEAEIDVAAVSMGDKTILGCRKDSGDTRFYPVHWANSKWWKGWLRSGTYWSTRENDIALDTRYHVRSVFKSGEQAFYVDGASKGTPTSEVSDFDSGLDMYLFAANKYGSDVFQQASAKIYAASIWLDGDLKREFVPCLDPNGEPAMYDRATGTWFRNGGTGADFAAGGAMAAALTVSSSSATVAAPLPPSVRYAYIQSDGTDDYIDLGVVGKDGTKMVAEMEWVAIPTDGVFCGARKDSGDTRFFLYSSYQNVQRYGYASGNPTVKKNGSSVRQSTGVRYRITSQLEAGAQTIAIQKLEDGAWVDDAANADTAAGPVDTGFPLYLFARNMAGTADSFCAARVYSLKLWQKDAGGDYQLVRHLVPAKTSDGAAALWDRVTETWFFNAAGAGALAAGAESPWSDGFVFSIW